MHLCVSRRVFTVVDDAVDAAGDDGVVVVEGPVVVHQDGNFFCHNPTLFILRARNQAHIQ